MKTEINNATIEEKENRVLDSFLNEILGNANDPIELFKALQRYDLIASAQAKRLTAIAAITAAENP